MTFDYTKPAATALKLLTKFGRSVTLRKQTAGAYDPATSGATVTNTDYTGTGALFDFNERILGTQFENGTSVQMGDKYLLLASSGITVAPVPNDLLIFGSDTWTVLNVKIIAPAGTAVLYELHLRK
jgi:hypothetical protein